MLVSSSPKNIPVHEICACLAVISQRHPYDGMSAAIATMHGKESVIAPILHRWPGIQLIRCDTINTDLFGTFTGEHPRIGTMLDAAQRKAKEAVRRSGCTIGVGSEGAFGPDPSAPFMASGTEMILLYHAPTDHEIYVCRRTRTNYDHIVIGPDEDPGLFLKRIGFPGHALVIKPEASSHPEDVIKGLTDPNLLSDQMREMARRSKTGRVLVQTDMRAHLNPTRMRSIGLVAKYLALRLMRLCPDCGVPGFGPTNVIRGLPCAACGAPTSRIKAETYTCHKCSFTLNRRIRSGTSRADPVYCNYCNP